MLFDLDRVAGDREYRDELRFRCITDHFFLGQMLGKGFDKLDRVVHAKMAGLYVKKKPGLSIEEQDTVKNMIDLEPREVYKTTMGHLDSIQWILVDPDMTILNEGATQPLAKAISNVQSAAFVKPKGRQPTVFQSLFPEYVVEKAGDGWYQAPCRTYSQVDMTIDTTSVQTSQSGFHPWVFNADDAVDTTNSGIKARDEVRAAVISNHYTNINTRKRGGYFHARGTRYHPFDLWNALLREAELTPDLWRVVVQPVMRVLSGRRITPDWFPEPHEVDILYPFVSYDELKAKSVNYESLMCQQMNDPQGGGLQIITEELYESCLVDERKMPLIGEVLVFWRPMYGGKDFMGAYAEGCACRKVGDKLYVIDAWRGMYTPSGFAEKVVETLRKHQTGKLTMEDVPGTQYALHDIQNEAARRNLGVKIELVDFDEEDGRRMQRMKALEPKMIAGRVRISTTSGMGPEMRRQFVHLGMVPENGIIDSVSRLALRIPASVIQTELEQEEIESYRRARNRGLYEHIYGLGGMVEVEQQEQVAATPMPQRGYPGLPSILGGLDG